MLCKVKATDEVSFVLLQKALGEKGIKSLVQSAQRYFVTVEIENGVQQELTELGFTVTLDQQFVID